MEPIRLTLFNIEDALDNAGIAHAQGKKETNILWADAWFFDLRLRVGTYEPYLSFIIWENRPNPNTPPFHLSGPEIKNPHRGDYFHLAINKRPSDDEAISAFKRYAGEYLEDMARYGMKRVFCDGGIEAGAWHEWRIKQWTKNPPEIFFIPTYSRAHHIDLKNWKSLQEPVSHSPMEGEEHD